MLELGAHHFSPDVNKNPQEAIREHPLRFGISVFRSPMEADLTLPFLAQFHDFVVMVTRDSDIWPTLFLKNVPVSVAFSFSSFFLRALGVYYSQSCQWQVSL
jgi:hypothetical protein